MKVSVYLKKNSSSTSNICFRVREKNVDIKVVSPLVVHDKYWDSDTLSYKRTTAVPAVEQKLLPEQIASIIEKVEKTFSDKANSAWLKQTIEDVLYPARAFERNHPNLICRIHEYLEKFDLPVQCLQSEKSMRKAGYDFIRSVAAENMKYVEVRFAPLFSAHEGFSTEQVIEALLNGLEDGRKDFGTESNIIVCAMRHQSEEDNLAMFRAARNFLGEGVCCGDLAGDEAAWPMKNFVYLFEEAKQLGLPFVIHAGECGSAENIREAVECGARRIGHGIAMKGHPDIIKLVKDTRTGVEMCPISNLQTKAVEGPEDYPMREFLDNGLLVTVNTDNRTVSNTSISRELGFIQETYGIRDDELKLMMENAVRVSFAGDSVKDRILKEIRAFG